jgi:hypothetical protein
MAGILKAKMEFYRASELFLDARGASRPGDDGDLACQFGRVDDQPHFGVEQGRARIEVEAADEHVFIVEYKGLGV